MQKYCFHVPQEEEGPTKELVANLIGSQKTLDTKMAASKLTLFSHSDPVTSQDIRTIEGAADGRVRRKAVHLDDMDDDDDDDDDDEDDDDDDEEEEEEVGDDSDEEWNIDEKVRILNSFMDNSTTH